LRDEVDSIYLKQGSNICISINLNTTISNTNTNKRILPMKSNEVATNAVKKSNHSVSSNESTPENNDSNTNYRWFVKKFIKGAAICLDPSLFFLGLYVLTTVKELRSGEHKKKVKLKVADCIPIWDYILSVIS